MSGEKCASVRARAEQDAALIRTRLRQIGQAYAEAQRYLKSPLVAECATEQETRELRDIVEAISQRRSTYVRRPDADAAQSACASAMQSAGEILGRVELRAQMLGVVAELQANVSRLTDHATLSELAQALATRLTDVAERVRRGEPSGGAVADMGTESTRLTVAAQVLDKNEAMLRRRAEARFMTAERYASERDDLRRAVTAEPERASEIEAALLQRLSQGTSQAIGEVASQDQRLEAVRQQRVAHLYTRVGDTFRNALENLRGAHRGSVEGLLRRTLEDLRSSALDEAETNCQRAESQLAAARLEQDQPPVAFEAWMADADELMQRAVTMAESDDSYVSRIGFELEGRIRAAGELGEARWRSQVNLIRRDLEAFEALGIARANREQASRIIVRSIERAASELGFAVPSDLAHQVDGVEDLCILELRSSTEETFYWQIEWLADTQTYRLMQDAAQPKSACDAFHAVTEIMERDGDPVTLNIELSPSARRLTPTVELPADQSTTEAERGALKEKEMRLRR